MNLFKKTWEDLWEINAYYDANHTPCSLMLNEVYTKQHANKRGWDEAHG